MQHKVLHNGTNRARTYDPLLVRQMLSQLSYDPMGYKIEVLYLSIPATRKGLEPSTSAVTGRRSNQLSHRAKYIFLKMDLQGLEPGTDRL